MKSPMLTCAFVGSIGAENSKETRHQTRKENGSKNISRTHVCRDMWGRRMGFRIHSYRRSTLSSCSCGDDL